MKNTLILLTTHRGVSDETYESVMGTECPNVLKVKGQACIDRARSIAFDLALAALDVRPDIDVVLCVDDDMVFSREDSQRLTDLARASGHPTSGVAVNAKGEIAARPFSTSGAIILRERWVTGLAFLAVPRAPFERVAGRLPRIGPHRAWCRTGEHEAFPGEWLGEDYWFCLHFGGVDLATHVTVGHVKPIVLRPRPGGLIHA